MKFFLRLLKILWTKGCYLNPLYTYELIFSLVALARGFAGRRFVTAVLFTCNE
jgi:hypothetical protein